MQLTFFPYCIDWISCKQSFLVNVVIIHYQKNLLSLTGLPRDFCHQTSCKNGGYNYFQVTHISCTICYITKIIDLITNLTECPHHHVTGKRCFDQERYKSAMYPILTKNVKFGYFYEIFLERK